MAMSFRATTCNTVCCVIYFLTFISLSFGATINLSSRRPACEIPESWEDETSNNINENTSTVNSTGLPMPLYIDERFQNPWNIMEKHSMWKVLKWRMTRKEEPKEIPPVEVLDQTLPVLKPDLDLLRDPPVDGVRVTWFGHATVLVQMDGVTVLADPIFSDRASPIPFLGPKRFRPVPCSVEDLPRIDAVVISHNHYDHLDRPTVQLLNARFGVDLRWFVPMGMASWFRDLGVCNVVELTWWTGREVNSTSDVKVIFTPNQHWSKRTTANDNRSLWGSWSVIGPRHRFFFAGDTGYCPAFKIIGEKFGPFDAAAIPIGAYEPRWFMQYPHVDPAQAVTIHRDVRSKSSLGIHWGTFPLAFEYYLEPPQKLKEALLEQGVPEEEFFTLKHGESRTV
jgi:N-acyl-phosphatidylethanolamine-hydrolysing phospholipase D